MTFIRKLQSLDGNAVFRKFEWPSDLRGFSEFNLVYGPNGSGKTTVSRVFDALARQQEPLGSAEIELGSDNNRFVRNRDFSSTRTSLRVFNSDFIDQNVRATAEGAIESIYIGSQSVQEQESLDTLRIDLQEQNDRAPELSARRQRAFRAFDRHCVETARVIKEQLRSPGDASNAYNNFNRADYEARVKALISEGEIQDYVLSPNQIDSNLQLARSTRLPAVNQLAHDSDSISALEDDLQSAVELVVLGEQIDGLAQDPDLAEWLGRGLTLHRQRASESCLYCERSPIPIERGVALRAHFSDAFAAAVRQIDGAMEAVERQRVRVEELERSLPRNAELYEDLREQAEQAVEGIRADSSLLTLALERARTALQTKKQNPFGTLEYRLDLSNDLEIRIQSLNKVVDVHNQRSRDIQSEIDGAREAVARSMIAESVATYKESLQEREDAEELDDQSQRRARMLSLQIAAIEDNQRNYEEAAERLQDSLRAYLGHDELEVQVDGAKYSFRRAGELATRLSEGEKTAVALLYFLQSLRDERLQRDELCVILDDPVSSLDEGSLYAAVSYIKEELSGVAQTIVLTHNDRLFSEIRKWFWQVEDSNKPERRVRYYSLETELTELGRCARISRIPAEFANRGSLYEYWFWRVRQHAEGRGDVVAAHGLPNIARRLLEQFCAYNFPEFVRAGRLNACLDEASTEEGFEDWRRERLRTFVNDESHGWRAMYGSAGIGQQKESRNVASDVLLFMEAVAPEHVRRMTDVVAQSS